MNARIHRRELLSRSVAAAAGVSALSNVQLAGADSPADGKSAERKYKLGMVTYLYAAEWDLGTIIERCKAAGISAVEFRTTHKHGVEPSLSKEQRDKVKKRCEEGGLVIWGLGSACDFHSPDPAVLKKNIEECKQFIELAHDLGAKGVKVRPNALPAEVAAEKTLEQIGKSLRTCGEAGASAGVEIWCEMHGHGTQEPERMRKIMDFADHTNVGVTWNSNPPDVKNGSVKESFELMKNKIRSCHINELISGYPYRELFSLFNQIGYDRYTLIETTPLQSKDPADQMRFLKYYKTLWEALSRPA